jgi:Na+-translocating ferredoxin:NAD+ oxidoreductase RnfG subunit
MDRPLVLFAAPLAAFAPAAHATTYLSVEQAQQAIFPGATFEAAPLVLTDAQARAIRDESGVSVRTRELRAWRVAGGGWFVVDEVVGKHDFITYAVGLDADGGVRGVEIMEYRESYGYQIRDPRWRAQFAGKKAGAPLVLDRDIRNISGATLSCRHVTDGVKRLLATHAIALK